MELITRAQWGAAPPKRQSPALDPGRIVRAYVHYVGSDVGASPDGPTLMRSIQRGHLDHATIDYADFAYNFAVHPITGVAYEGRGWHTDGATEGWGGRSVSILVMSGDEGPAITTAGIATVAELVAEAKERYPKVREVLGHKEAPNSTSCPGTALLDLVHAGSFTGGSVAAPAPIPVAEEDDMRTQIWRDPRDGAVYEIEMNGLHKKWVHDWGVVQLLVSQLGLSYGGDWHPALIDSRVTIGPTEGLRATLEEIETNIAALMAQLGVPPA